MSEQIAPTIMLQGTGSHVGKSVLCAALCRIFLQDGYRVAPFKAQNMALNSFVTSAGGEMGRAQVVQAQACRLNPAVNMNPVLIKPVRDDKAQIIVRGQPVGEMTADYYHRHKPELLATVAAALQELREENDIVVIEGAGSPAEINLRDTDIVNMATAELADAPVVLVGDIDKGGVFASLFGTIELLENHDSDRIKAFIINKFRGDRGLLQPGLTMIEERTSRPVLGVVPFYDDIRIPEEDSVNFDTRPVGAAAARPDCVEVAVLYLPHISNFTDFDPLEEETDVTLRYIRPGDALGEPDILMIPGTKNTVGDYRFLQDRGCADGIRDRVAAGRPVFGICGGYQMLGKKIVNPHRIETTIGEITTLGFLDLVTEFQNEKTLRQVSAVHEPSGLTVTGYEIHMGATTPGTGDATVFADKERILGTATVDGLVAGTYIHGIFDDDVFRRYFINQLRERKGLLPLPGGNRFDRDKEYDKLASLVRQHCDLDRIYELLGGRECLR